jgi:hypothetical protein
MEVPFSPVFFSLTFFGNDNACMTLSTKNEYEEEQNQSFSLFFVHFFSVTQETTCHTYLCLFFFSFSFFFMSTCRTLMLIRLLYEYNYIRFCYYYYHQENNGIRKSIDIIYICVSIVFI